MVHNCSFSFLQPLKVHNPPVKTLCMQLFCNIFLLFYHENDKIKHRFKATVQNMIGILGDKTMDDKIYVYSQLIKTNNHTCRKSYWCISLAIKVCANQLRSDVSTQSFKA